MTTPTAIPDTQRAWLVVRRGKPVDAVELHEVHPVPKKLEKGEVLVKVQAAAYNPVGHKIMGMLPNFIARRPHVAENDFAGIIVDANGTEFENGQEVYGWIPVPLMLSSKQGALSEYTCVPARLVRPKPSHVKTTEAAGIGLASSTAYHALFSDLKLEPGQSLFINGGSTAVGICAIQLAKAIGCTVTVSASGPKEELLKSLGVDRFIDYKKGPVYEQLEKDPPSPKFHAFLEAVGTADPQIYVQSEKYLAPGGVLASVSPQPSVGGGYAGVVRLILEVFRPRFLGGVNRSWVMTGVSDRPDEWKELGKYIADGKVKTLVDSVFAFEDVQKGYERVLTSRSTGKVVVKIDPSVE